MRFLVKFTTAASKEAAHQAAYLEEQRLGYGYKFLALLKQTEKRLSQNPELYPTTPARMSLRYIRMPKPFHKSHTIFYRFDGQEVVVVCVFNNSQSEKYWQDRG